MGQSISHVETAQQQQSHSTPRICPVSHDSRAATPSPATCPVHHQSPAADSAQCPVDHDSHSPNPARRPVDHASVNVNPLNQMPDLPQQRQSNQSIDLPLERSESSIPRDTSSRWEYPSPQQFYNALVRKGWETPEEHVVTMVEIHNFLNEEAWEEVKKWEKRRTDDDDIQLSRFKGKPGEMSPKARLHMFAGWLLPSRFSTEPPFDRHDWIVRRPKTGEEVRYIIDYYSAPPEDDGSPVFSLDVRPALDSFTSVKDRIAIATQDVWAGFRQGSKQPPSSTTSHPNN